MFRLIPDRDADTEQKLIDMQAAEIAGFYDPELQETYVVSDDDEFSAIDEVILAHQITHALQDQHFDLGQIDNPAPDFDGAMAFRAIFEGDAVLLQEFYAQRHLNEEQQTAYQQEAMAAAHDEDSMADMD